MAKQTIGIGTSANDGTGDPLRDAFDKVNDNFNEVYSAFTFASNNATAANNILIGNSTVNSVANSTTVSISNSTSEVTATSGSLLVGNSTVNTTSNSSTIVVSNSTSEVTTTSGSILVGNSTVNTTSNSSTIVVSNSTSSITVSEGTIAVGNSTVNTTANSSLVNATSVTVNSNTGLTLGTSNTSANGFTYLPNGLIIQYGSVDANTTVGDITFANVFPTGLYSLTVTTNIAGAYDSTYQSIVIASNTSTANVRTANVTAKSVRYTAIGK